MLEEKAVNILLKYRYLLSFLTVVAAILIFVGAKDLYFEGNYDVYFAEDNPERLSHDLLESDFSRTDSLIFVIHTKDGDFFSKDKLEIVKKLTDSAWLAPYSIRVNSITNFQSISVEEENLTLSDLVNTEDLSDPSVLAKIKHSALNEPELLGRFIAKDGKTAAVQILLELPTVESNQNTAARKTRERAFAEVVAYGKLITRQLRHDAPNFDVHLLGIPVMNHAFNQSAKTDALTLIPLVVIMAVIFLIIFLRSIAAVIAIVSVVTISCLAAIGLAGWAGQTINNITINSPIIIMTLGVCNGIHIITNYRQALERYTQPIEAMYEGLLANLQPVVLTGLTTALGFFTLNFSDSPPFQSLGNIAAVGVLMSMAMSLTLLPTLTLLIVRKELYVEEKQWLLERLANFTIKHRYKIFVLAILGSMLLVSQIPKNHIDDDLFKYFKPGTPVRDAGTFTEQHLTGVKNIDISISCEQSGCINEPDFLETLELFREWLERQTGVAHVSSYSNAVKRINKAIHGNDSNFYTIPETRQLAAQYQLLYEISLPYGLDLSSHINQDKSATRVGVMISNLSTGKLIKLDKQIHHWFQKNHPQLSIQSGSVHLMFASNGERNIRSMVWGALTALASISLALLIVFRSFKYALISVFPNACPAIITLGIWGAIVGEVNLAVSVVFSITLGIVVDDTVHFLCKYRLAKERYGFDAERAVRYAFSSVGEALIVTTAVLATGFCLMMISDFNVSTHMGALTAITIIVALFFDLLILPTLLLLADKRHLCLPFQKNR